MIDPFSHALTPGPRVLAQQVGEEAVLLDLASECYFGLDPVGARAWQLLQQQSSLATVYEQMRVEFAVAPERLRADLVSFVQKLLDTGLITAQAAE